MFTPIYTAYLLDLLGSFLHDVVPGLLALLHELPHEVLQVCVDRRHAHHARLLRELQLYTHTKDAWGEGVKVALG